MVFGAFGGPTAEMQKSLKRNKSQLNKRNSLKENLDSNKNYGATPIKMNEFSEQEAEDFRTNLKAKRRKEQKQLYYNRSFDCCYYYC